MASILANPVFALALLLALPVLLFVLLARTSELRRRVEELELRVGALRRDAAEAGVAARAATATPGPTSAPTPPQGQVPEPVPTLATASAWHVPAVQERKVAGAQDDAEREAPRPDGLEQFVGTLWRWFTEGNVPVKVGMVVLFAGVGALLKYATDQGWMSFPIEFRLAGIATIALVGLAFGGFQRDRRRAFALSLQGGSIGVLLMTSFAAFKLYALLPPLPAFLSWVVLVAAAGALAVWQESRALAVLGILAGFMAPVLMSTGSGNHVVLFSFHAVLNAAIFGVAWRRSWRELNLLGFAFTFGIGTWWGVLQYSPDQFATTLPFLVLFFAFYALIPIIHARRDAGVDGELSQAGLVFGTPLVSFALLAALLDGDRTQLALSALGLAALYAVLAWLVVGARAPLLRRAHQVLAWGFATLSVPLALSAQATAGVFALEGAALVWFGLAQSRALTRWTGAALQVAAALCLLDAYDLARPEAAIANAAFTGALLLALAGFASAWCHDRGGRAAGATGFHLWGLAWWLVMGVREITLFVPDSRQADALLGFAALTAGAAALVSQGRLVRELGWTVTTSLAAAIPLALLQADAHQHPFAGYGLPAWVAFAAMGGLALWRQRARQDASVGWAHASWLFAWPLAVTLWLRHAAQEAQLASGWMDAALTLPWVATGAALLLRPGLVAWPLAGRFPGWREPVLTTWMAIVTGLGLLLLVAPGDAAPLPWVPLLNSVELSLIAACALLLAWLRDDGQGKRSLSATGLDVAVAALLVVTSVTLRAVHQLGGVPWSPAMFDSGLAQASLSLVWSVLGVAGWIAGSRRRHRGLWQVGAVLMGVVLLKLVLVDRMHLGNLQGIASFIGYGLLCTLVGYLAPAPPREAAA